MGDRSLLDIVFISFWVLLGLVVVGSLLKNARKLSTADWIICVGASAAIVSTFLPWYGWESIQFSLWDINRGTGYVIFTAGAVALAAISSRVMFYGKGDGLSDSGALLESIAMLAASVLVTLFVIIRLVSVPDLQGGFGMFIVIGRSWGLWVGLVAAAVFATGSVLKIMEER
jgi:hypothetical protein